MHSDFRSKDSIDFWTVWTEICHVTLGRANPAEQQSLRSIRVMYVEWLTSRARGFHRIATLGTPPETLKRRLTCL